MSLSSDEAKLSLAGSLFPIRARLNYVAARLKRKPRADLAYRHHVYLEKWDLVYFYVPKVACTSIKSLCADLLGMSLSHSPHESEFPKLDRPAFVRRVRECESFAVMRDPIDRLVSGYKSMVMRPVHDRSYHRGVFRPLVKYGGFQHGMAFADFCRRVCQIPDRYADAHFRSQSSCFSDANGVSLAKRIILFDEISTELPRYLERTTNRPIRLPKQNTTPTMDVSLRLRHEHKQLIRGRYAADYEVLDKRRSLRKTA